MGKLKSEECVQITALSHDGRGITHVNGKTVFVSGALPGESVKFIYQKKHSQFAEARVTAVIKASPLRQTPKCVHFDLCGGCSLQYLSTAEQMKHKQTTLLELLKHQAHVTPQNILPPLTAESWGYRHKARMGVKFVAKKNKVLVGFREIDARFVADLSRCEVLHPAVGLKVPELSEMFYQLEQKAEIRQIEISITENECALIVRHMQPLTENDLAILKCFAEQHHFKIYLQPKGHDSIHVLYPKNAPMTQQYCLSKENLIFDFLPQQFTQVNPNINQKMIQQTLELLALNPTDRALDLFCGIGNFTLPIAKYAHTVVGVEGDSGAISQAKHNATLNKLANTQFYCDNLFDPPFAAQWSDQSYNKILLDPPRSGAKEVIDSIAKWSPERIVYVSCNPITLARDTAQLCQLGYQLTSAGVMDMFPHTQHVEAITLFQKGDQRG